MRTVDTFAQVLGEEQLIGRLRARTKEGAVPHALLFTGEEGSGKKTLASLYAKLLLCENGGDEPCLTCASCRQVADNAHPDIYRIEPETGKGGAVKPISVALIRRELIDSIQIKPYKGPYKIYIVDRAEKLTTEAQNALLKTLEEPPSYAVIILLATGEEDLLETVRSRCVTMRIERVDTERIQRYLQEEGMAPDYRARPAARFAQGNVGKAAELAASDTFDNCRDAVLDFFERAEHIGYDDIVSRAQELAGSAKVRDLQLELIQILLRDILTVKAFGAEGYDLFFADRKEAVGGLAERLSYPAIAQIQRQIYISKERIEQNVAVDMVVEGLLSLIKETMQWQK